MDFYTLVNLITGEIIECGQCDPHDFQWGLKYLGSGCICRMATTQAAANKLAIEFMTEFHAERAIK